MVPDFDSNQSTSTEADLKELDYSFPESGSVEPGYSGSTFSALSSYLTLIQVYQVTQFLFLKQDNLCWIKSTF